MCRETAAFGGRFSVLKQSTTNSWSTGSNKRYSGAISESFASGHERATDNSSDSTMELQDFSNEASSLFANVRIPAALFAGAAIGAAYAMPVGTATTREGLLLGFTRRIYALLMIHSLSAEIVALVVATVAMIGISAKMKCEKAASLPEWMELQYEAEWFTCTFSFLSGIISFCLASGLRAWLSMGCPVLGASSLGLLVTATLLSLAFVDDLQKANGSSLMSLPIKQARVLWRLARRSPLFFLSFLSMVATILFTVIRVPHLYRFLARA